MGSWIAAKSTPTGDVLGVHNGDRGILIGSVPGHDTDEPGAYLIVPQDDIPALVELLKEAIVALDPTEKEG